MKILKEALPPVQPTQTNQQIPRTNAQIPQMTDIEASNIINSVDKNTMIKAMQNVVSLLGPEKVPAEDLVKLFAVEIKKLKGLNV